MGLRDDLLRGIYNFGFEKPSAIQQRAIIPITSGRDVIAQAQYAPVIVISGRFSGDPRLFLVGTGSVLRAPESARTT